MLPGSELIENAPGPEPEDDNHDDQDHRSQSGPECLVIGLSSGRRGAIAALAAIGTRRSARIDRKRVGIRGLLPLEARKLESGPLPLLPAWRCFWPGPTRRCRRRSRGWCIGLLCRSRIGRAGLRLGCKRNRYCRRLGSRIGHRNGCRHRCGTRRSSGLSRRREHDCSGAIRTAERLPHVLDTIAHRLAAMGAQERSRTAHNDIQ